MWSCCATPRKTTFHFENGTRVKAEESFRAIELLKSISLKNVLDVENIGSELWVVRFHSHVSIKIEAPDQVQALRTAEWLVYLDRRDPKVVKPHYSRLELV